MTAKCDDDIYVLMAICDVDGDWVFDFVHSCYICRDKKLFTRLITCDY